MLYHLYIRGTQTDLWNEFLSKTSPNLKLSTKIFSALRFYLDNHCALTIQDIPTLRRLLQDKSKQEIDLYAKNIKQISMLLQEFQ